MQQTTQSRRAGSLGKQRNFINSWRVRLSKNCLGKSIKNVCFSWLINEIVDTIVRHAPQMRRINTANFAQLQQNGLQKRNANLASVVIHYAQTIKTNCIVQLQRVSVGEQTDKKSCILKMACLKCTFSSRRFF